ncbi:MAG: prepilin-type N-terminal cleavage/methylation domain-containing protein [Firmicutes bacterium]|nr:prepilin-type N-terminal cleavage/methylation domain-containing protein [Bacillota bacterium]
MARAAGDGGSKGGQGRPGIGDVPRERGGVRRRGERGFTVVEVMVAVAVLAVVGVGIYGLVHAAINVSRVTEGVTETQEGARFGVDRIVEEARWAVEVLEAAQDSVRLKMSRPSPYEPGYYEVVFRQEGSWVTRRVGEEATPLSTNVEDFRLTYWDAQGNELPFLADGRVDGARVRGMSLEVTAVSKGQSVTYRGEVWFRNLGSD